MKTKAFAASFLIGALLVVHFVSPIAQSRQAVVAGKDDDKIIGTWTMIGTEHDGKVMSPFAEWFNAEQVELLRQMGKVPTGIGGRPLAPPPVQQWTFTKDKLETKYDAPNAAAALFSYKLQPGEKVSKLDIIPLDADGKPMVQDKSEAIYILKDDVMIIIGGAHRPEHFSSPAGSKTILTVLHRGKLK